MFLELNIDALVGPSHHFGGLGVGNVASQSHAQQVSHPREAALEGIDKAELISRLGIPQYIWLPPMRPRLEFLRGLGFDGPLKDILSDASDNAPQVLSAAFSSAFMWAANSATVAPACDTNDGKYRFSVANLISSWHRGSEAAERLADLKATFGSLPSQFYPPLPSIVPLRDEGAANHMRLCDSRGENGIHLFVHGAEQGVSTESKFYPRHTKDASEALARRHGLDPGRVFFLHQHPEAISAGVFHNDVIATSHRNLVVHHERAFLNAESTWDEIEATFKSATGETLHRFVVDDDALPLEDAVRSYLFNSQIVTATNDGEPRMAIVCPRQCEEIESAQRVVQSWVDDPNHPIQGVHFVSLAESMANGGGPACLRLRVHVEESLLSQVGVPSKKASEAGAPLGTPAIAATPENLDRIRTVVRETYPAEVRLHDLRSTEFVTRVQDAVRRLRTLAG